MLDLEKNMEMILILRCRSCFVNGLFNLSSIGEIVINFEKKIAL